AECYHNVTKNITVKDKKYTILTVFFITMTIISLLGGFSSSDGKLIIIGILLGVMSFLVFLANSKISKLNQFLEAEIEKYKNSQK
ncbi:MAG: hypothetical protein LBG67_03190, partial [Campylobacteraceae bacterium]|nr:hypothetical protein [Campylobacteraceae bacterium]